MLALRKKSEFPVWGDMFGNIFNQDWTNLPLQFSDRMGNFPAVNVSETEAAFKIEMAAPGKQKEDFNIDMNDDLLTISSEVKDSKEEKTDKYTRREFSYQSFKRSFRLPEIADAEKISASYTDGILKIVVPKKEVKQKTAKTIVIS